MHVLITDVQQIHVGSGVRDESSRSTVCVLRAAPNYRNFM